MLGRMGSPNDISNAIIYLASDASEWVTGTVLSVDMVVTLDGDFNFIFKVFLILKLIKIIIIKFSFYDFI